MIEEIDHAEKLASILGTSLRNYMPATQAKFREEVAALINPDRSLDSAPGSYDDKPDDGLLAMRLVAEIDKLVRSDHSHFHRLEKVDEALAKQDPLVMKIRELFK